ncbi:hypothetical protein [uncultured Thiothrix sp.]|jgi:hypothetical protein|uniref:hypothetical protein n=1 Tax=uncultured Thiothrix sp. TaxID=223185 RepID=UPI0026289AC4|nr:hypothetical protein [uncultured Thiothrix sp.]HMT91632.1 hypothetical protein [Thiolinea sp.]
MRLGSVLTSTALLAVLSTSAQAAWQSIPGAACSPLLGNQTTQFNKVGDTGYARIGAGSAWVSCPLHRTMFVRKLVYVNLNHPSARGTLCKIMRSNYLTGAANSSSATAQGTGNVVAGFNINITALGTMAAYDTYSVSCNVAQGTTIRGVSWEDN